MALIPARHQYSFLPVALGVLMSLVTLTISQAQLPVTYDVKHYKDEEGLPQNSVKAIMKDAEGFIWLATENGLVRYDGNRFFVYDKSNLNLKSGRLDEFLPAVAGQYNTEFIALSSWNDVIKVANGKVSLDSSAEYSYFPHVPFGNDIRNASSHLIAGLPNRYESELDIQRIIIPLSRGRFYLVEHLKISYYVNGKVQYERPFCSPSLWSFFAIHDQLFWSDGKKVIMLSGTSSNEFNIKGDILKNKDFKRGNKFEIFFNPTSGESYIYINQHLFQMIVADSATILTKEILSGFDCKEHKIIAVYYDQQQKRVYLGSTNQGLFVFTARPFSTLVKGENARDDIYYSQAVWNKDQVITPQGNVLGLSKSFVLPEMKKEFILEKYSMLIDSSGNIWTVSSKSIKKFNPAGTRVLNQWKAESDISQIYEGRNGQMYMGTRSNGIFTLDIYSPEAQINKIPGSDALWYISYFLQQGTDTLWLGTANGLFRLVLPSHKIDSISALANEHIKSLYLDEAGRLWGTINERGIFLISNNAITQFPCDRQGYLRSAHYLVPDSLGHFFIPTNKGLFLASKQDLLNYAAGLQMEVFYLYFGKESGFLTNEFNGGCQPCAVSLPDGTLSLPSLNGLVWINPGNLALHFPDKGILIDRIEKDELSVDVNDTLPLPRQFKAVKIYCSTPYSGNPYNVQMEYSLSSTSDKSTWISMDNNNAVTLSTLPHGTYNLTIRKPNGFGVNNYSYSSLILIVAPAFYQTAWFYTLVFVIILFLAWLFSQLRLQYSLRKNRQLEELVNNRTEELSTTLKALTESELGVRREMQLRQMLFTSVSHDIGSPLRYISEVAGYVKDDIEKKQVSARTNKYVEGLFQSGHYLYHFTRNLLQSIRLIEKGYVLQSERFNLHDLVKGKTGIFEPLAKEKQVKLENNVATGIVIRSYPLLLSVIVHNLLDNAIKVSHKGVVAVTAVQYDELTILSIKDSGPGMPLLNAAYLQQTAKSAEDMTDFEFNQTGFGLPIVKKLLQLMNATAIVETSSEGTTINIRLGSVDI